MADETNLLERGLIEKNIVIEQGARYDFKVFVYDNVLYRELVDEYRNQADPSGLSLPTTLHIVEKEKYERQPLDLTTISSARLYIRNNDTGKVVLTLDADLESELNDLENGIFYFQLRKSHTKGLPPGSYRYKGVIYFDQAREEKKPILEGDMTLNEAWEENV